MTVIPITFQSIVAQDITIFLNGIEKGVLKEKSNAMELFETKQQKLTIKVTAYNYIETENVFEGISQGDKPTFLITADEESRELKIERKY